MRTKRIFIGWVMSIVWFLGISIGYAQLPTVDLTTHQPTAAPPAGATFEWHNGFPVSAANLMTSTQAAVAVPGVYYGVYNFGTCYSQASPLRVATNSCPTTTVDLRAFVDSTAKPFGTIVTFHSALPASNVNRLTASAVTTAGAGTFYVAFYDPVALCFSSASVIVVASTSCVINYPPVVVVPPIVTTPGVAKTVCGEINDPNVGDTHTVTVCGAASKGTTVQTVNNQTGKICITYTPNVGQTGVDNVCLVVCDQGGLCDTVRVPITIVPEIPTTPTNQPPVVVVTPIITVQDSTTTTCMPILDPNGLGTNSFTICGAPKHGTANPITTVGGQLCITYTPSSGYFGRDSICVIVCDNGIPSLCDTVNIPITVYPRVQVPTIPQPPIVSLPPIVTKEGVPVSICGPISDPNGSDTHTVTQCNVPLKGSVSGLSVNNSSHEVCLTYTPQAGKTGNDKVCLTICDQGNLCVTVEVPVTIIPSNFPPACLTMELKVLLEGPFNPSTSKMTTTLNQRGLLPGQTPIGDFAVVTPKGQPYNDVPWNYTGTEGHASGFIYPNTVVDWVLVSLRTDSVSVSNVWKGAGLLHDDGTITFIQPCYTINTTASALFVVVEHRNHLGVMSPTKVPIVAGKISFDFTQQDSYVTTDPPSFGQIKDATTNKWLMYAADGNKDDFFENFDINFNDSNRWKLESGIFDQYKKGDYNMDADVNFSDSVLWKKNNGRYSRTPH